MKREDHEVKLRTEVRQQLIQRKRSSIEIVKRASLLPEDLRPFKYQLMDDSLPSQERFVFLVDLLLNHSQNEVSSLELIRKVLSAEKSVDITDEIGIKLGKKLLSLLKSSAKKVKKEAAWCLTNLACVSSTINRKLVHEGAITSLASLMSAEPEVADLAISALTNFIGDCPLMRNAVADTGVVEVIIRSIADSAAISMNHLINRLTFLACLVQIDPLPPQCIIWSIFGLFTKLFAIPHDEVRLVTCSILMHITKSDHYTSHTCSYVGKAVEFLSLKNADILGYSLDFLGLIARKFPDKVLNESGLIDKLGRIMESKVALSVQSALRLLCNLLACRDPFFNTDMLFSAQQMKILSCLQHPDSRVVIEALCCVYNISCRYSSEPLFSLVALGLLDHLSRLLTSKDPNILRDALVTLATVLEVASRHPVYSEYLELLESNEGLQRLQDLQTHPNNEIYEKSVEVLAAHFEVEEVSLEEFVFS